MSRKQPTIAALLALLLAPAVTWAAGSTPSSAPATPALPELTPQQKATESFNRGLGFRDKAWELEEEAAAESDARKAEKKRAKAEKAFRKAEREFRAATREMPDFYQAWSSLGYALRRLGDYQESLQAYDQALAIEPRYPEAIEYRGEAYLGLDRIEEAKAAYMQLFQMDRERAAELMTAMKRWLEQRSNDAGELSQEVIEDFATWVEERSEMVAQVGTLASVGRSW